jgi:hypothetical protein
MTARTLPSILLAMLMAGAGNTLAEVPPIEDYLPGAWYAVEVIVFERAPSGDGERVATATQPPYPRELRALVGPDAQLSFEFDVEPEDGTTQAADPDPQRLAPSQPSSATPPSDPRLAVNERWLDAVAAYEKRLAGLGYRWREKKDFQLAPAAATLARRGGFRLLMHGAWIQPVPQRDSGEPLLVQAGEPVAALYPLEGTFEVTVGRYLHFEAVLALRDAAELDAATRLAAFGPPGGGLQEGVTQPETIVLLSESRRMRSGELNYLDHPRLGVLVRIDRVTADAELLAAYADFAKAFE